MRHFASAIFVMGTSLVVATLVVIPLFGGMRIAGRDQVAMISQFGAQIAENPTNKLALEFKNRAEELDKKEKRLIEMQASLEEEQLRVAHRVRNILASTILLSLITLYIMNHIIKKRIVHAEENHDHIHEHQRTLALSDGLRVRLVHERK